MRGISLLSAVALCIGLALSAVSSFPQTVSEPYTELVSQRVDRVQEDGNVTALYTFYSQAFSCKAGDTIFIHARALSGDESLSFVVSHTLGDTVEQRNNVRDGNLTVTIPTDGSYTVTIIRYRYSPYVIYLSSVDAYIYVRTSITETRLVQKYRDVVTYPYKDLLSPGEVLLIAGIGLALLSIAEARPTAENATPQQASKDMRQDTTSTKPSEETPSPRAKPDAHLSTDEGRFRPASSAGFVLCPSCGGKNEPTDRFCRHCGGLLVPMRQSDDREHSIRSEYPEHLRLVPVPSGLSIKSIPFFLLGALAAMVVHESIHVILIEHFGGIVWSIRIWGIIVYPALNLTDFSWTGDIADVEGYFPILPSSSDLWLAHWMPEVVGFISVALILTVFIRRSARDNPGLFAFLLGVFATNLLGLLAIAMSLI